MFHISGRLAFNQQKQKYCANVMNTDICQSMGHSPYTVKKNKLQIFRTFLASFICMLCINNELNKGKQIQASYVLQLIKYPSSYECII